ncbi:MAG: DNA repair protein RadA [Ilumatobacter sp.]|nr:DNA repair protein RadA [Ilumatobacter sp.]
MATTQRPPTNGTLPGRVPRSGPTSRPTSRVVFACSECGADHVKWAGRCSSCGDWNTLVEELHDPGAAPAPSTNRAGPTLIGAVGADAGDPISTSLPELDRVLGGGIVPGAVTLLGGEPGIGKSTLLLQLLAAWDGPTLYVSAEESAQQVRLRAERLGAVGERLWLHAETSLPHIVDAISTTSPELVVIDSIQTVSDPALGSLPGSVAQVRGCANRLVNIAKERGISVVLVGHVTKDGGLAGPRVLEHVVDTVLQFEGDKHHALRLLRAAKHRFGPTNELGLFEMAGAGLIGVPDPSTLFLADRRTGVPGSAVVPTMEGQRPIVVEVQALTTSGVPGVPSRRSALGLDGARLSMLMAVLARRVGLPMGDQDVYASTAGGVKLVEPGLDLGVCLAVVSALRNQPLPADLAVFGEVGLGGELRQVGHAARRLTEAARLGFKRVVVPANSPAVESGIRVLRASTLDEAVASVGLRTGGAGPPSSKIS